MTTSKGRTYQGVNFRAHNPEWAFDPEAGDGALRYGGRFKPVGRAALYTALSPLTAIREASQTGRPMEPLTICEYEIDCDDIFDATDPEQLALEDVAWVDITRPDWNLRMLRGEPAPSHEAAETLIRRGYAAILVPSFATGAGPNDMNLVSWDWARSPSRL